MCIRDRTEIYQQPATWKKTCQQITELKDELKAFINQVTAQDDYDIILTGACLLYTSQHCNIFLDQ